MRTVEIRKKSLKTWLHIDNIDGQFIVSKFYFNADNNNFQVVEQGQSKRFIYEVENITVFDDTVMGTAETFSTITELSLRLEVLKYPAFYTDGEVVVSVINDVIAGANISIDKSDPQNPIISSTGGNGIENVTQRIFTVTLSDIGATDFTDDIPAKIKTYAIANGIQKLPNETHDWEVIQDFNFYLRISGTDMYDNYGIEDEATFVSYLAGQGATNIAVTDFYLSADTLRCNLSFDGVPSLDLGIFGITKIEKLDSLVNLTYLDLSYNQITTIEKLDSLVNLTYLDLGGNQITTIEKLDSLVNLTYLDLGGNQLTTIENLDSLVNLTTLDLNVNQIATIENLDSLVNLNYLYLNSNQITTTEFNKLNSWAILAPNNGLIYTSNNIDNFNLSTTYTTLLAKGWTIYL